MLHKERKQQQHSWVLVQLRLWSAGHKDFPCPACWARALRLLPALPGFSMVAYGHAGTLRIISRFLLSGFGLAEVIHDPFARSGTGGVDRLLHGSRFRKTDDWPWVHLVMLLGLLDERCDPKAGSVSPWCSEWVVFPFSHTSVNETLSIWWVEAYLTATSKCVTTWEPYVGALRSILLLLLLPANLSCELTRSPLAE